MDGTRVTHQEFVEFYTTIRITLTGDPTVDTQAATMLQHKMVAAASAIEKEIVQLAYTITELCLQFGNQTEKAWLYFNRNFSSSLQAGQLALPTIHPA
jgi:hypothetical protein